MRDLVPCPGTGPTQVCEGNLQPRALGKPLSWSSLTSTVAPPLRSLYSNSECWSSLAHSTRPSLLCSPGVLVYTHDCKLNAIYILKTPKSTFPTEVSSQKLTTFLDNLNFAKFQNTQVPLSLPPLYSNKQTFHSVAQARHLKCHPSLLLFLQPPGPIQMHQKVLLSTSKIQLKFNFSSFSVLPS